MKNHPFFVAEDPKSINMAYLAGLLPAKIAGLGLAECMLCKEGRNFFAD